MRIIILAICTVLANKAYAVEECCLSPLELCQYILA